MSDALVTALGTKAKRDPMWYVLGDAPWLDTEAGIPPIEVATGEQVGDLAGKLLRLIDNPERRAVMHLVTHWPKLAGPAAAYAAPVRLIAAGGGDCSHLVVSVTNSVKRAQLLPYVGALAARLSKLSHGRIVGVRLVAPEHPADHARLCAVYAAELAEIQKKKEATTREVVGG